MEKQRFLKGGPGFLLTIPALKIRRKICGKKHINK